MIVPNKELLIRNVLTFLVFGGPLTRLRRRILAQEATFRFGLVRATWYKEQASMITSVAVSSRQDVSDPE